MAQLQVASPPDLSAEQARRDVTAAVAGLFADPTVGIIRWSSPAGDVTAYRAAHDTGFRHEGTARAALSGPDGPIDAWLASMTREELGAPATVWLDVPVLLDGPVTLRPMHAGDAAAHLEMVRDPETERWFGPTKLRSVDDVIARLHERILMSARGHAVPWAIAATDTDRYLGKVDLFDLDGLDHSSAEIGYALLPAARGQGVMRRAVHLAIRHAFTPTEHGGLGIDRIHLSAGDGNEASQAVAEAFGFTRTGIDRQVYALPDDQVGDLVRFDLLRREFEAR